MDVVEVLQFKPQQPDVAIGKRGRDNQEDDEFQAKRKSGAPDMDREQILQMVEDEPESEALEETSLKKMLLQFEKRVSKNQEMRIKYPDMPEKFLESEMELNDILQEMHIIATAPDLYHVLVELNAVRSLLQLLSHENTDVSIAVVDLLQEMTDVDTLTESEEGASDLIDAMMDCQVVALLVQNVERLDETVKEEIDGVHNSLAILENMMELRQDISEEVSKQGSIQWILKRLKAKMPFDANKLYCSEILAIILQNSEDNRKQLGEVDGIDVLLQQLATYKRHDPSTAEELEFMENLFNCLCSALMLNANRDKFLYGEGLQLMNLMLREKKSSRLSALKVLDHAMTGKEGTNNCQKFVDILGLRSIFPLFMKTPKGHKKAGTSKQEIEEHIVSIISSMLKNCTGSQRQRLMNKFTENDHEKVDRLMELHFKYLERLRSVDAKIEKEKESLRIYGGEIDEEQEDQFYMQRLEAGLFSLQLIDYITLDSCQSGPSSVKQRVMQMLNVRGGSVKAIRSILREYAGNLGDAEDEDTREQEQQRILQLLDKF